MVANLHYQPSWWNQIFFFFGSSLNETDKISVRLYTFENLKQGAMNSIHAVT